MEYKRLCDIGCGKRPKEGWVGLDITPFPGIVQYDMTQQKMPYADDSVDAIRCINTLEHVERKYYKFIFNEWHRVLKIGAIAEFQVPNFLKSAEHALADITHLSLWVPAMIKYITGERPRYADYGFEKWTLIEKFDYPEEERDLVVRLTPQVDKKTGKKYERN